MILLHYSLLKSEAICFAHMDLNGEHKVNCFMLTLIYPTHFEDVQCQS